MTNENENGRIVEYDNGTQVGIFKDEVSGRKDYYNVVVRKPEWRYGKTVATRCTLQKATEIAETYA